MEKTGQSIRYVGWRMIISVKLYRYDETHDKYRGSLKGNGFENKDNAFYF